MFTAVTVLDELKVCERAQIFTRLYYFLCIFKHHLFIYYTWPL